MAKHLESLVFNLFAKFIWENGDNHHIICRLTAGENERGLTGFLI